MAIYHDLMSMKYVSFAREFTVNPKKCDNPRHYETFIKQDCFTDQKQGMGVTHVFVDEDKQKIVGYITLRASSLTMDIGESYKLGFPALEIAELAVDQNYENQGLGTDMVKYAISEAIELNSTKLAFQYVILCADVAAVKFYSNEELNFKEIRPRQEIPRESRNKNCKPMMLKIIKNI